MSNELLEKVSEIAQHVEVYERDDLQKKALSCVPVAELTRKAQERLVQSQPREDSKKLDFRDFLLLELLAWFKHSFFSWVDKLNCDKCGCASEFAGQGEPTLEEIIGQASRVELYQCQQCGTLGRFPRYNDPGKLLETRKGRCGEWANCFTLLCRALMFEARYIYDWTDHVWTEVFSFSQNRWLHCDPCENICDAPLLYEVGWGKTLSYIFAFSKYEVQDVTWRYSQNHLDVLKRRTLCSESKIITTVLRLSEQKQKILSPEVKKELTFRRVVELIELMLPKNIKEEEKQGRISGSLLWRAQRSELGNHKSYVFKRLDKSDKIFNVKYSSSKDCYVISGERPVEIKGWRNGIYSQEGMFLKVEHDWKKSYLARTEDSTKGHLSWKFDFSKEQLKVAEVKLLYESATFENGKVQWTLSYDEKTVVLSDGGHDVVTSVDGAKSFILKAEVSGGRGACAWQHAQLFRQDLDSTHWSLDISVQFAP